MQESNKQKILIVIGPTASGKSNLALRLAKLAQGKPFREKYGINGAEIISADSRQVYRGMDIGTGKVLKDKTFPNSKSSARGGSVFGGKNQNVKLRNYFYSKGIRHHLIDIANPKKQFTADDFVRIGQKAINDILSRGKLPIICGGTGFYIDALVYAIPLPHVLPNKKLRKRLEELPAEKLFEKLRKLDSRRAKSIDRHNKRRLIRALEIVIETGKPVPKLDSRFKILDSRFDTFWIGIDPGKEKLAKRIESRLDVRLRQGMIAEVEKLHKDRVSWKRLDDFGLEYRWVSRYLRGHITKKEMRDNLLRDIIKYSKRQITWWRRNKKIQWIRSDTKELRIANKFGIK